MYFMSDWLKHLLLKSALCCSSLAVSGAFFSCTNSLPPDPEEENEVYLAAAVNFPDPNKPTRATGATVNTDIDDQLVSVRLIIARSADGTIVHNHKHNPTEFLSQPIGKTAVWKSPFKLLPGTYDFFFIANEEGWNLSDKLQAITHANQLFLSDDFTRIDFTPAFKPTRRKPMIYTQCYRNVVVPRIDAQGKGTYRDPQHFQADGDEEVELIRTLSKVELTVKEIVRVEEVDGVMKPTGLKFRLLNNAKKIRLVNVPKYFSLFLNPYFGGTYYPTGKQYSNEMYLPTELREVYDIEDEASTAVKNSELTYTTPTSAAGRADRYYDYKTTVYLPEHLRQYQTTDPATGEKGYVNGATSFHFVDGNDIDYYKFSIWQSSLEENKQATLDGNAYFVLPNVSNFSKFSIVRNNFYRIEAEENAILKLNYRLVDWDLTYKAHIYVGENFNVVVKDPNFENNTSEIEVITSNSVIDLNNHKVELRPLNAGAFNLLTAGKGRFEAANYIFGTQAGEKQNQAQAKLSLTFAAPIAMGADVFAIYYNDKLLYTVKKQ